MHLPPIGSSDISEAKQIKTNSYLHTVQIQEIVESMLSEIRQEQKLLPLDQRNPLRKAVNLLLRPRAVDKLFQTLNIKTATLALLIQDRQLFAVGDLKDTVLDSLTRNTENSDTFCHSFGNIAQATMPDVPMGLDGNNPSALPLVKAEDTGPQCGSTSAADMGTATETQPAVFRGQVHLGDGDVVVGYDVQNPNKGSPLKDWNMVFEDNSQGAKETMERSGTSSNMIVGARFGHNATPEPIGGTFQGNIKYTTGTMVIGIQM
jgi:hypothetical protein